MICYRKGSVGHPNRNTKISKKIEKECGECKKIFKVNISQIETGRGKFCSKKCLFKSWEGRIFFSPATYGHKGKTHSVQTKQKMREKALIERKNRWKNPEYREKMLLILKENFKNSSKERWSDREFREKQLSKMMGGLSKRPTSLEKQMIGLIRTHNLPYKYTGNGDFWIGGKNPDFVNINGEKKLIEVGNVFHHQNGYEEKRRKHFAKYGWKSYIFIGDTLNKKEILNSLYAQIL